MKPLPKGRKTKKCSGCGRRKALKLFGVKRAASDGRTTRCLRCINRARTSPRGRALATRWYRKNRKHVGAAARDRVIARKAHFIAKMGGQCRDCGLKPSRQWPVACFDFHHVDPSGKDANVARLLACGNVDRIAAELTKCVVLCANCHRRTHAKKEN